MIQQLLHMSRAQKRKSEYQTEVTIPKVPDLLALQYGSLYASEGVALL